MYSKERARCAVRGEEKVFRVASTFFRAEGLRLRGVVRWPTVGKVHRMTPTHRARSLLTPPTEGRMASATSCYPHIYCGYTVMFPGLMPS